MTFDSIRFARSTAAPWNPTSERCTKHGNGKWRHSTFPGAMPRLRADISAKERGPRRGPAEKESGN